MPFNADDFYVGMIAYFTINGLTRAPHIRTTNPTRDAKPRPFICYAEADGDAYWTCLTTTPKPNRKTLARRWLRYPARTHAFAAAPPGDLIVSDARGTFAGPITAFADCSRKHDRFPGMLRPVLLPEGVAELRRYVKQRGGILPPTPVEPRLAQAA